MGADFIGVVVPACKITDEREVKLHEAIENMSQDDINWDSALFEKNGEEEGDLEKAKEAFKDAIRFYKECEDERDVGKFKIRGVYYYITGGLSGGDLPTASFAPLEILVVHGKFDDFLESWAAEDCQQQ